MTMTYQDKVKDHMADYKRTRLGIDQNGVWKHNKEEYPHILPEALYKLNILETYRKEFWLWIENKGEIKLHQGFHHLNSSQAMCFNLFFPFVYDKETLGAILMDVLNMPDKKIKDMKFEHIENQKERTNFDFFVDIDDGGKVYFELKYSENEFGRANNDPNHKNKYKNIYRPGLHKVVNEEYLEQTKFFANYQIMRNLYYLGMDKNNDNYVIFVFPQKNEDLQKTINEIVKDNVMKEPYMNKVQFLYVENIVDSLQHKLCSQPKLNYHYSAFREKYIVSDF